MPESHPTIRLELDGVADMRQELANRGVTDPSAQNDIIAAASHWIVPMETLTALIEKAKEEI